VCTGVTAGRWGRSVWQLDVGGEWCVCFVCKRVFLFCEKVLCVVLCKSPYSSVVEHPLSKRKVGSSILPGGNFVALVSRWCECSSCRWCAEACFAPSLLFSRSFASLTTPSF
jgi:hypothetical protein